MGVTAEDVELSRRMERVDALIEEFERGGDAAASSRMAEIVRSLLDFHGQALAPLASSLLALHGLHPLDIETRVRQALDEVQPYLAKHGGHVEFLGVEQYRASLRLEGSCHGCPSSQMTLKNAIEEAIYAAAPEIEGIDVEGVVPEPTPNASGLVQLQVGGNGHDAARFPNGCEIPLRKDKP
jgi:Fe-S cluster biogenesis protein NfuA